MLDREDRTFVVSGMEEREDHPKIFLWTILPFFFTESLQRVWMLEKILMVARRDLQEVLWEQ